MLLLYRTHIKLPKSPNFLPEIQVFLFLLAIMTYFLNYFGLNDQIHVQYAFYNHADSNLCPLGQCSKPKFKVIQNWHFLAIFDYFWDWECYQIDENIFQTSYFSENHQWKCKMLMYHSYNSNFLGRNGWFFVFWKLIGEVPWLKIFNFGKKWSHIGWRNSS